MPSPDRAVTLAHGSRGAVTGPWAGELLAAALGYARGERGSLSTVLRRARTPLETLQLGWRAIARACG